MSAALLEIENLTKSFGGVHAIRNCTFAIPEGQGVGLIDSVRSAGQVVQDFKSEFLEAVEHLDGLLAE